MITARFYLLFASLFSLHTAFFCHTAEAGAADLVCILVYPCDEEARLLPEYNDPQNPCFEFFRLQCDRISALQAVRECEAKLEAAATALESAGRKAKRLRRRKRLRH